MRTSIFLVTLLTVFVATSGARAENTTYVSITEMKAFADNVHVLLETDHQCGTASGSETKVFKLLSSSQNYDLMAAMLLTAYSGDFTVRLMYDCSGNNALITGVRVKK